MLSFLLILGAKGRPIRWGIYIKSMVQFHQTIFTLSLKMTNLRLQIKSENFNSNCIMLKIQRQTL